MDNYSRITKKTRTQPELKVLKRASKSYEALQQGFVISLLNTRGYGFIFNKPDRRAIKTIQSLVVKSIIHPNGFVFEFDDALENHCKKVVADELRQCKYYSLTPENVETITAINKVVNDGYDIEILKQIKRHREANRNSIAFNWLVDYAEQLGIKFGKRASKPAHFTAKMIKITSVVNEHGGVEINQDEIEFIGNKFNEFVFDKYKNVDTSLMIKANDDYVYNLVYNHEEIKGTFLKSMYENEMNGLSSSGYGATQNNEEKEEKESVCEMKEEKDCDEIQSKTVTIQCQDQNIEMTQQDAINNLYQSILDAKQSSEMNSSTNGIYNFLPTIEMNHIETQQTNDNVAVTTQTQNDSIDEEQIRMIREFYDKYPDDESLMDQGFLQSWCYNYSY